MLTYGNLYGYSRSLSYLVWNLHTLASFPYALPLYLSLLVLLKKNPEGFNKINTLFLIPSINTVGLTHT